MTVRADGRAFTARLRLDTPRERDYLKHGGILPFVRQTARARSAEPRPTASAGARAPAGAA